MQRLAFACHIAVLINEKGCATRELATVAERRTEGNVFYRVGGTNIGGKETSDFLPGLACGNRRGFRIAGRRDRKKNDPVLYGLKH